VNAAPNTRKLPVALFFSLIASRKTGPLAWRIAPIGIALLLAARTGSSRHPKATEKITPVRIPLRHLAPWWVRIAIMLDLARLSMV